MKKGITTTFFAGLIMLATAVHAQEVSQQNEISKTERVVVNSRPLSAQLKEQLESDRQKEYEFHEENLNEASTELGVLIIPIKTHHLATLASNQLNATAANFSPYHFHWVEEFPQDNMISIEDGSEWIFDQNDIHVVRTWRPHDTIVITPRTPMPWGSSYAYTMTNKDLGSSVYVNLFLGPIKNGVWSTWVAVIDQKLGQIYLMNGQGERTVWEVSNVDMNLLRDWRPDDTVIIGENDSWLWWFSSYDHVLINVNMDHYIRARQASPSYHRGT